MESYEIRKAEKLQFENQGFLHLRQLMTPEMTVRLREAYTRAQSKHIDPLRVEDAQSHYDITGLLDEDRTFSEVAVIPALLPYLVSTVGEDVQLIQTNARLFPPGKTFTAPWHSDMANTLGIGLHQSPNFHIKVHFYFEDLLPNQGCLAFLPGTHRLAREVERPHPRDIDIETDATVIVPKAGDAVLFNTHCMHMCVDNTTSLDRRTLIYSYSHFWVKQYASAVPTHREWVPEGKLEQQIFGYGAEGVEIFDQRPWSEPRTSPMRSLYERVGRRIFQ